jgi:hypothetical protein
MGDAVLASSLLERETRPGAPGVLAREAWLLPFQPPPRPRTLRARLRLEGHRLAIRYVLEGELEDLVLPLAEDTPRRLDGLWQATCFEAFLATPGSAGYHEFNMALEGHWAAYAFNAPRQGMRHETALCTLSTKHHRVTGHLGFRVALELNRLALDPAQGLELGISAILQRQDGTREFWALSHPSESPDFHCRSCFLLKL